MNGINRLYFTLPILPQPRNRPTKKHTKNTTKHTEPEFVVKDLYSYYLLYCLVIFFCRVSATRHLCSVLKDHITRTETRLDSCKYLPFFAPVVHLLSKSPIACGLISVCVDMPFLFSIGGHMHKPLLSSRI